MKKVERLLNKLIFFITHPPKKRPPTELDSIDIVMCLALTLVALGIRFWRLGLPSSVVFDEVYFGNFSNFYIKNQFYYDIHPPLGKLIMFWFANLSEYDGSINFNYVPASGYPIPDYVQLRITPAVFSSFCFPLIYLAMRFSGFSYSASGAAAVLALFDTSTATEGRYILSDGLLHFFCMLHVTVLMFTMQIDRDDKRFVPYHFLTGITLGAACSCKNTAWGLMALDAFAYTLYNWPLIFKAGFLDFCFEEGVFGGSLLITGIIVYCISFFIHFIQLPFAGPGTGYLQKAMKDQLIPNANVGSPLWTRVLQSPNLFERTFILSFRMHKGNMGIKGFHDSQTFPHQWPLLTSTSVFFWHRGNEEIRCFGNAIVYYIALLGVILCGFGMKNELYLEALRFFVGYCVSYFPFFLIPRVLYLYHYIIPLFFGCMCYGACLDLFIKNKRLKGFIFIITAALAAFGFWLWCPYVYGTKMHDRKVMDWTSNWIQGDATHRRRRKERDESKALEKKRK